ncbi:MAG: zf-HC2 domain-containing protein [Chloroflexota bacterium]|nr:zf-HC2 domain-containing protein [Chloroflexota bacterium]
MAYTLLGARLGLDGLDDGIDKGGGTMTCPTIYDELMSLKLDGSLDAEDDSFLDTHLVGCEDCQMLWDGMQGVNLMLLDSAKAPLQVPVDFTMKVMSRVLVTAVTRPLPELAYVPGVSVGFGPGLQPFPQFDLLHEWQRRVAAHGRAIAATAFGLAGTVGLLLALVVSGVLHVSGELSTPAEVVRMLYTSVATWLGSLFETVGPAVWTVGALLGGLLVLACWQVMASYHRTTLESAGSNLFSESVA